MSRPRGEDTDGPRVSRGGLIRLGIFSGLFFAIFIAVSVAMGNYIILSILIGVVVVAVLIQMIRGKPLVSLIMGEDHRDDYRIEGGLVAFEREGESWIESLSNYEGVLWHEETVRRGGLAARKHRGQDSFQIIELRHREDRARDVEIYTSREIKGMRARWEEAARAFDLPALRDMGDGKILRREPGNLDKSLRQLAREGNLDEILGAGPQGARGDHDEVPDLRPQEALDPDAARARWAVAANAFNPTSPDEVFPGAPPPRPPPGATRWDRYFDADAALPSGVRWYRGGELLDIRLRKAIFPYVLVALPVAFFALLVGYLVPADPFNTVLVIASPALLFWLWIMVSFRVLVTPRNVAMGVRLGPIPLWRRTMSLDEIEEVLIGKALLSSAAVLVEGDRTAMRVGPLSDEAAEWLAWFLRAAIVTAPEPPEARKIG